MSLGLTAISCVTLKIENEIAGFRDGQGLESLTLVKPSSNDTSAVFAIGVQNGGAVYRVDSEGIQAGAVIDAGDGLSALQYDPESCLLFAASDKRDKLAVIDVHNREILAVWDTRATQEEGLAMRKGDGIVRFYMASDEGGGGDSFVSEHATFSERAWLDPPPEGFCQTTNGQSEATDTGTSSAATVSALASASLAIATIFSCSPLLC